jgi:hypothetical protein
VVALASAGLLLVAIAAIATYNGRPRELLNESEEYLQVPRRLRNLAADHDDRDGLAQVMNEGHMQEVREVKIAKAKEEAAAAAAKRAGRMGLAYKAPERAGRSEEARKEFAEEEHAKELNAVDAKMILSTKNMVPWVQWPKSDDQFYDPARKQSLLQVPHRFPISFLQWQRHTCSGRDMKLVGFAAGAFILYTQL